DVQSIFEYAHRQHSEDASWKPSITTLQPGSPGNDSDNRIKFHANSGGWMSATHAARQKKCARPGHKTPACINEHVVAICPHSRKNQRLFITTNGKDVSSNAGVIQQHMKSSISCHCDHDGEGNAHPPTGI